MITDYTIQCYLCGNEIKIVSYETDELILCPKCYHSIKRKSQTKCRNKELDPKSASGIGYITEILVSKYLGLHTCFELTDNFNYPKCDLPVHEDFGTVNSKGSSLLQYDDWSGWSFDIRRNKIPDFFFCIGYDSYREHVECTYFISNEIYISDMKTLRINEDWSSDEDPYFWFRQDPKPFDELYQSLNFKKCHVLSYKDD